MLFLCLLFLLVNMQFLDAAQQSKSKIKFDLSKLHPVIQKYLEDGSSDDKFTAEVYQECCAKTQVMFLDDAVDKNDYAKIKELVEQNVDVNANITSDQDIRSGCLEKRALHIAAARGYVLAVEELLKAKNIDVNVVGAFHNKYNGASFVDMTPLMLALTCGNVTFPYSKTRPVIFGLIIDYERIVRLLIKHGADVTAVTQGDNTCRDALLFAIQYCTHEMIKTLLNNGANVHATYQGGFWNYQTVLKNAIDRKDLGILKMVLDAGADIEEEITVRLSHDKTIETTPLCYCLKEIVGGKVHLNLLEELLFRGAKMDASYDGETWESMMHKAYSDGAIKGIFERVDKRTKEFAEQAEKIVAPEFLLLDLAKIVSEYIAAPIGKS